jgi:hypothetical protein
MSDTDFGSIQTHCAIVEECEYTPYSVFEETIRPSFIVEEPQDDINYESRAEAAIALQERLIHEMDVAEEKDELRRGGSESQPTRSKSAPAPRKRAKSRARKPNNQSKVAKMRSKHMRSTIRDAERIIAEVTKNNEGEDIRKVRIEAQHAQQQATASLRELRALLSGTTKSKEALKQHSDLTAKLRRFVSMQEDDTVSTAALEAMHDVILSDCIEVITSQATAITTLHDRVNKLVRLYSENTAKCEATSRRVFDTSVEFASSVPAPSVRESSSQPKLSNGTESVVDASAASASASVQQHSAVVERTQQDPNDPMFMMRTGNGFIDVVTRAAPQIVRGKPGTHYISFSVARRKGSAQQIAQSETVRSAHNVQRWAKLAKKKRAFGELIIALPHLNGDDALKQLCAPESESLARITGDDGEKPPAKAGRKRIAAAPADSTRAAKKKK